MTAWFENLRAILGETYPEPIAPVDPAVVSQLHIRPEREDTYTFEGRIALAWHYPDGTLTSASPAQRYSMTEVAGEPPDVLGQLALALELPGEPPDYHFAIQTAADALWAQRRDHHDVYDTVERLYRLDLALLNAHPEIGTIDEIVLHVDAFDRLGMLYEREGFLPEALELAEADAARGFEAPIDAEELRERLDNLAQVLEPRFPE